MDDHRKERSKRENERVVARRKETYYERTGEKKNEAKKQTVGRRSMKRQRFWPGRMLDEDWRGSNRVGLAATSSWSK